MNPYAVALRALGRTRGFAWLGSRFLHHLDRPFRHSKRSVSTLGTDFPLCYLTVAGRRTGRLRTVPLLHVADGARVVLIASNWGRRAHPAWALNLDAALRATVTVAGAARELAVRRATRAELERYWAEALRFWPGYEGYRRRAGREIRMYVLEPPETAGGVG